MSASASASPRPLALALITLALLACGASTPPPKVLRQQGQHLPVSRVVLYQNGIGYFERAGRVDGALLSLQARSDQINDILKSLTVIASGEGRAVSVSLPLEKTAAQALEELPEQVRQAGGLVEVLRVSRGARVEIDGADGRVTGRVLGLEQLQKASEAGQQLTSWRVTLKTDDEALRVYPVDQIERVLLLDQTLRAGLDKSLDVALNEGSWKPIGLDVHLAGPRGQDVQVSYIVAMPLWKPAYRLVLPAEGDPLLQGWAVVDNMSGEDWRDIKLSLVAGTPMSFIYDLHSPMLTQRVDLTPQHRAVALAPVVEKAGTTQSARDALQRSYGASRAPSGAAGMAPASALRMERRKAERGASLGTLADEAMPTSSSPGGYGDEAAEQEAFGALIEQQGPAAEGQAVGALFRYDLKDPVTVPDRSSTLVAIINNRVKGKEVVLFRPELTRGAAKTNPYRAAMFVNGTPYTIEKGPVAIYARQTFVGEGFVDRLDAGTTTFVTYAIDGKVSLRTTQSNKEEGARLLKIQGGLLVSEVLSIQTSLHQLENLHREPVTAYVKSGLRHGYSLRARPKDTIETADAYFLPIEVPPGATVELREEWVRPVQRSLAIDTDLSTSVLKLFVQSGQVPKGIEKTIKEVLALKERLDVIAGEEQRLQQQRQTLSQDQERVRDNLNLLRRTPGNEQLKDEMIAKLGQQEAQLGRLTGKLVELSEERASLQAKMHALIGGITLDAAEPKPGG